MKTWRVTSPDTADGLRRWRRGVSEAFVRLEPTETSSSGFFGQITQVETPDMAVSIVRSDGHSVHRLREHIRFAAPDVLFVNILRAGRSLVRQKSDYVAAPMDISVLDTRHAFSIQHDAPFELASIAVDANLLPAHQVAGHLPLSRSAAGREISFVMWGLARTMLELGEGKPDTARAIAAQFCAGLAVASEIGRESCDTHVTLDMLQSYIARSLSLPDLRASDLAQHFGLSVRRVHQLFEPSGQSVSDHVNAARLDAAADMLANPGLSHMPIGHIGTDVGYLDVSYFNRRFRRRFGCSPRALRESGFAHPPIAQ